MGSGRVRRYVKYIIEWSGDYQRQRRIADTCALTESIIFSVTILINTETLNALRRDDRSTNHGMCSELRGLK